MSDSEKPIGLMLRLPPDLHAAIVRYAAGSATHAATSLNRAVVFLLRAGLAAQGERSEPKPGEWMPESLALVEA
jgi:hypothetical protein